MPIEFRCSQCNQLLRVPDTAAGKSARCPKCQALMTVPVNSEFSSPTAESSIADRAAPPAPPIGDRDRAPPFASPTSYGTPSDVSASPPTKPRSENPFGESGGSPFGGPATVSANPYASPAPTGELYAPPRYLGVRPGLPWESEPQTLGCWFRTMGMVIGSPTHAFSIMQQQGGLGTPLKYNAYAVGMLLTLAAAIGVPIALLVGVFAAQDINGAKLAAGIAAGAAIVVGIALFYALVVAVIFPFIMAGVFHVGLMLFGGARQGFETTYRASCYAYFSILLPSMIIGLVPYLGGLAAMVWMIVLFILGLSRAHETTGAKATGAVLTPFALCCGLYIAMFVIMLSLEWAR
jgi:phage FluMu protein Com